jgi:hypothetical protein
VLIGKTPQKKRETLTDALHYCRYHKQFYHGISSVSGAEFVKPVDTRWVDQDLVEGLCHQCHQWVAVSNVKRKNSVLWFRHAHKVKKKKKKK